MPKNKRRAPQGDERAVHQQAVGLLAEIGMRSGLIADLENQMAERIQKIQDEYAHDLTAHRLLLKSADTALLQIMKMERKTLFARTDVVNLVNGSLIRNEGYKVTIPRDALGKCEELGFDDVIKTVKSLDREAVEKWDKEKLELIGAERKPATKYSYEVKERRVGP
jgi:phage host-nuclease inhibitor protein Gam